MFVILLVAEIAVIYAQILKLKKVRASSRKRPTVKVDHGRYKLEFGTQCSIG